MRHTCNLVTSSQNRNDKNSTTSNLKDASSELAEITLATHSDEEANQPPHRIKCFQRQRGTVLSCGASMTVLYRDATWYTLLPCQRWSCFPAAETTEQPHLMTGHLSERKPEEAHGWGQRRPQAFVLNIIILYVDLYIASFLCDLPPTPNSTHWQYRENVLTVAEASTSHLQWINSRSRYFKDREEPQKATIR